jgi:hypothetical protein
MPTVLLADGFRFFFFSNEGLEPPHIHVDKGDGLAKLWLSPPRFAYSEGFNPAEARRVRALVTKHEADFLRRWNEHFGR